MKMKLPTPKRIMKAIRDKSGSEALEMVYGCAALCALILSAMMILGYAMQTNNVAYAGKRIARYIEVSGQANQTDLDALLRELLPNASKIGAKVTIEDVSYVNPAKRTIQLREKFTVHIKAKYPLTLANPGNFTPITFDLPINVYVNGQSEIYWKT